MPLELRSSDPGFDAAFARLLDDRAAGNPSVRAAVEAIIADVMERGDEALIALTERYDRLRLSPGTIRIGADEIASARAACPKDALDALEFAAGRIREYHELQKPRDLDHVDPAGIRLGWRWTAIDAVGLYVPGGLASYPSSVLMNAIPARVAGVERLAMTVPAPDGAISPLVLAAADIAGIDEIYRIGGAQAIAALALGTGSVRAVDKIVGPGNAFVAEAKRQLFGRVGIDTIAGPSEILVIADAGNDPLHIAADLLSQAEHGTDAQAILITADADFAKDVAAAVDRLLETLPRTAIAAQSWRDFGAIILVRDPEEAAALANRIAPEHLILALAEPELLLPLIRHAGAIFMGRHCPEAVGDYVAGPDHVLPTMRAARFASGLSVLDFMKRSSIMGCDAAGLARIGPMAVTLAKAEGLDAHALSVSLRLGDVS
ncbi:MAG: histidinol dehydrogenase [Rhodothalassiaceae bacterium]